MLICVKDVSLDACEPESQEEDVLLNILVVVLTPSRRSHQSHHGGDASSDSRPRLDSAVSSKFPTEYTSSRS